MRRELLAQPIEVLVLFGIPSAESAIGLEALPAIERNVAQALRAIPQQTRIDVTGRLAKERNSRSVRPIVVLELFPSLGVNVELPEVAVPRHKALSRPVAMRPQHAGACTPHFRVRVQTQWPRRPLLPRDHACEGDPKNRLRADAAAYSCDICALARKRKAILATHPTAMKRVTMARPSALASASSDVSCSGPSSGSRTRSGGRPLIPCLTCDNPLRGAPVSLLHPGIA